MNPMVRPQGPAAPQAPGAQPPQQPAQQPAASVAPHPDGGVIITLMPPVEVAEQQESDAPKHFDDNLAEKLSEGELGSLAAELLDGISADVESRREWIENYNKGMDLLGLKLDSAPVNGDKSVSRVRHPLLLEAIVKGQALARGELLPAAGPVKVEIDGPATPDAEQRAVALQSDMNHYLTNVATEYYPDTDRGLFYLYYGGVIFKKVYRCPLRERPVSECVYPPDLIVSNDATDIANAQRVTHRIEMNRQTIEQLQSDGVYLEIALGEPIDEATPTDSKEAAITGIAAQPQRQKDRQFTIYECYTKLNLSEYGIDSSASRPLPYRVTMDLDSRRILEIRRDWIASSEHYTPRKHFVKYGLIPGLSFMDLGFLHLLGNHTKALTALLRITIDAGMFANFPGGLKLKGARPTTNEYNPGPGEFVDVDAGGITDIRALLMPMPYQQPSPVLLELITLLAKDGEAIAGTAMVEVGEGRTNVPVGTMMAMVEQQTQVMSAIHKRLHASQAEEFAILKGLFAEDPASLWAQRRNPARQWNAAQELADLNLIPVSDPNIPAQVHRLQQNAALMQMAQAAPQLFNLPALALRMLRQMGIGDPETILANAPPNGGQPGQPGAAGGDAAGGAAIAQAAVTEAQIKAQSDAQRIQAEGAQHTAELQTGMQKLAAEQQSDAADRALKLQIAQLQDATKRLDIATKSHNDALSHQREQQSAFAAQQQQQHQQTQDIQAAELAQAQHEHGVEQSADELDLQEQQLKSGGAAKPKAK